MVSVALPSPLESAVAEALVARLGPGVSVQGFDPVGGGCVNNGGRLAVAGGDDLFLKWNPTAPRGLFAAEAGGLEALAETGAVRVPAPLAWAEPAGEAPAWLLLEWLPSPGPRDAAWAAALGRSLASLHAPRSRLAGFGGDTFIGPTRQVNGWDDDWPAFFRDRRLAAMAALLDGAGLLDASLRGGLGRLLARVDEMLAEPAEPLTLLHGDLWGGNLIALEDGSPALVDPAVYYGHREADLAMAGLFGWPPAPFREAYEEVLPLAPGFGERAEVYNLYHLMNHALLFGGGYLGQVRDTVDRLA